MPCWRSNGAGASWLTSRARIADPSFVRSRPFPMLISLLRLGLRNSLAVIQAFISLVTCRKEVR